MSMDTAPSVLDVLRTARGLIENPENWTKGEIARNSDGKICAADGRGAVCWCSVGAVDRAWLRSENTDYSVQHQALTLLDRLSGREDTEYCRPVAAFNDSPETTHADVLALFDHAIAEAALLSSQGRTATGSQTTEGQS